MSSGPFATYLAPLPDERQKNSESHAVVILVINFERSFKWDEEIKRHAQICCFCTCE